MNALACRHDSMLNTCLLLSMYSTNKTNKDAVTSWPPYQPICFYNIDAVLFHYHRGTLDSQLIPSTVIGGLRNFLARSRLAFPKSPTNSRYRPNCKKIPIPLLLGLFAWIYSSGIPAMKATVGISFELFAR